MGKVNPLSTICIAVLKTYRYFLSPLLGNCCRFYPSCSVYAIDAIKECGLLSGSFLTFKRLLRCHPFSQGGVDFIPERKKKCQQI